MLALVKGKPLQACRCLVYLHKGCRSDMTCMHEACEDTPVMPVPLCMHAMPTSGRTTFRLALCGDPLPWGHPSHARATAHACNANKREDDFKTGSVW